VRSHRAAKGDLFWADGWTESGLGKLRKRHPALYQEAIDFCLSEDNREFAKGARCIPSFSSDLFEAETAANTTTN
jgi:hypothetical protein